MGWIGLGIAIILFFFFFRFTMVREGTAKAIVRLGGFKKIVMAWKGYKLDEEWNVVPGKAQHYLPGGLRFVGIWPMDKVYKYKFRWQGIEIERGKEKIEFKEELISHILVRPDTYWTKIEKVETTEKIPTDLEFLLTIRVGNPYKALFAAPPNWLENVLARFNGSMRGYVSAKKDIEELLTWRKKPKKIWEEFGKDPIITYFKENWGIEIIENGIELRNITLPPRYEVAAARERELKFEAEAKKTQFKIEAEARASETVESVIQMMAKARGRTLEEIQKEIDEKEDMKKEFLTLSKDLIVRKLGIEGGAYVDIRVQGAEGLEKTFLNLLAAWKRMPSGRAGRGEGRIREPSRVDKIIEIAERQEREERGE